MPIEIRELVIKATVVQEGSDNLIQTGSGSNLESAPSEREDIIKTCVEKVLEILKERNGR